MGYFGEVNLGSSFQPFTVLTEQYGFVPGVFRAQSLAPKLIDAEVALVSGILFSDKALARAQKECVLLTLAAACGNTYCFGLHYQMLKLLGVAEQRLDRIASDYQQVGLAPMTQALLNFSLQLAPACPPISRNDVRDASSRGLSDESILEIVAIAALSHLFCVLSTGVGVVPDFVQAIPPVTERRPEPVDVSLREDHSEFYLQAPDLDSEDFVPFSILREQFGYVPSVFRAQALRPDLLEAEVYAIQSALVSGTAFTREVKERILLAEARRDLDAPGRALHDFATKLSTQPQDYSLSDIQVLRDHGFTDEQILEAVGLTALAGFFNVLQVGLGAAPDFAARWASQSSEPKHYEKLAHLSESDPRQMDVLLSVDPDAELVARVQSGDLDSFEELMNRHSQRVYRTLIGILKNPDDACDALQDTFLKSFQSLPAFQRRSRFSTWLISIAINTGIQRLRERRPSESLDESSLEEDGYRPRQVQAWTANPEQLYSQLEMRTLIETRVMALPTKYRMVLMLRDINQLPIEDTASALGLGIPAVKARLLRGRLMLREALAPHFAASGFRTTAKGVAT